MNNIMVCGFVFDRWSKRVVLIKKEHPEWMKGLWNGVGGHIEPGETASEAMTREFKEETGVEIAFPAWRHFADLRHRGNVINFLAAFEDCKPKTMTREVVAWHHLASVQHLPIVPNLKYLIPMALDQSCGFADIEDPS